MISVDSRVRGAPSLSRNCSGRQFFWIAFAGVLSLPAPALAQQKEHSEQPTIRPVLETSVANAAGKSPQQAKTTPTGSNIISSGPITAAPLIVVDQEEFRLSGATHVEQVLNTLPQIIPHRTPFFNIGADGTVDLDLRGLGPSRTLVLVNGRRWIPVDFSERIDLNTIPAFLIDGVDILTGAGSAVYGAGAVAGVVNFRFREIDGLIAGANSAVTERGDGGRYNVHVGYGARLAELGRISVFAEYSRRNSVAGGAREVGRFDRGDDPVTGTLFPQGSSATPQGRVTAFDLSGTGTNYERPGAIFATPGVSRPFNPGSASSLGDFFNYQPFSYLQVPQERWLVGARAEYEITRNMRAYIEGDFINNRVTSQQAPQPFFSDAYGGTLVDLAAVAPHLSLVDLEQLQLISQRQFGPEGHVHLGIRYRPMQAGPRRFENDRDSWRALGGLSGTLAGSLTFDVFYQQASTRNTQSVEGAIDELGFNALIANGTCNVFGANLLSVACLDAIVVPLRHRERSRRQTARATVSGPLLTSPWSDKSVDFALGAEWHSRRFSRTLDERMRRTPSTLLSPLSGQYNATEHFGELRVPISSQIELSGGLRYSDYSLSGVDSAWSWFAGAEATPLAGVTFRGNFQRAVRTPDIAVLFAEQSSSVAFLSDPCGADFGFSDQSIQPLCVATGVPPELVFSPDFDPFVIVEALEGGNPGLKEEISKSWTAGVVLKPSFLPRLIIAADYYNVKINGVPRSLAADDTVNTCYFVHRDAASPFCRAITRDPQSGAIVQLRLLPQNLAALRTRGVDLQVNYVQPMPFGLFRGEPAQLAFHLVGNWTDRYDLFGFPGGGELAQEFGLESSNVACAGRFGATSNYRFDQFGSCGEPKPQWSWNTRLSWLEGPVTASVRWRRKGPVRDDYANDPFFGEERYEVERIGAYNLFDLAFSVRIKDHHRFSFGINNLLDRQPPILGGNSDIGVDTWPGTYDVLGRDFYIAANVLF